MWEGSRGQTCSHSGYAFTRQAAWRCIGAQQRRPSHPSALETMRWPDGGCAGGLRAQESSKEKLNADEHRWPLIVNVFM